MAHGGIIELGGPAIGDAEQHGGPAPRPPDIYVIF